MLYLNCLLAIYKSFVSPHLDYGDMIYDKAHNDSPFHREKNDLFNMTQQLQ